MVEEARLEEAISGLAPVTPGWFVVNVRDAAWETNEAFGAACFFEGDDVPFAELGINLRVLSPGRSKLLYHAESFSSACLSGPATSVRYRSGARGDRRSGTSHRRRGSGRASAASMPAAAPRPTVTPATGRARRRPLPSTTSS
jgi:hypothetical protein